MKNIRVGSRESRLAVVQSEMVMDYIKENCPEYTPELVTMKTTGDRILDRNLDQIGGKGLFVKELDAALMDGRSDMSVHSLKDMPAQIPEELPLIGGRRYHCIAQDVCTAAFWNQGYGGGTGYPCRISGTAGAVWAGVCLPAAEKIHTGYDNWL